MTNKKIVISLLLTLCFYSLCFAKENNNQDVKEPYYTIDFMIVLCNVEIKVNDISIFSMEIKGQVGTAIPANNAIFKSGEQKLSIELKPLAGETQFREYTEARFAVELIDASNFVTISNEPVENFKASDHAPMEKLYKEYSFHAEVPYTITILDEAQDLRTIPDLENKLKNSYMELISLIEQKNFSEFEAIARAKEVKYAQMFYLSEAESSKRVESIIKKLKSGEYKLNPFPAEVTLHIKADGKVASLKNKNDNEILTFTGEDDEELGVIYSFYLPKGSDKFVAY